MELYNYKAIVTNIVDGDTIDVQIDLGFHITAKHRVRLLRINTAELNSKDPVQREFAQKAKQFLVDEILHNEIFIHTEKSDSFGRYLAEVFVENGDEPVYNLNDFMLVSGLAQLYKQ